MLFSVPLSSTDGSLGSPRRVIRVAGVCSVVIVTNINGLLAAYDEQMRGAPSTPPAGVRYEQDGPLLRTVGQSHGFIGAPRDVGARGSELDRLIVRQRDYFAARGEPVRWKTHDHDRPSDLTDRLRAAGFVPEGPSAVLIGLTAEVAATSRLPDGVVLRRVTGAADMHRIAAMESDVWGQDLSRLGGDLIACVSADPDGTVVMVVEADGEVVCAAWLIFRDGTEFASLRGGTTRPAWRGQGIYRALVAARAELAVARGVRYLHVDASDDSSPILRRLGFHPVAVTTQYVWSPPQH